MHRNLGFDDQYLRRIIFLIAATAVLGACAMKRIEPPEVSLVDLRFGRVTVFQTDLLVKLEYQNQSPREILVNGSTHKLSINGEKIGRAASNKTLRLPSLGTASQVITLRVNNLNLLTRLRPLIESHDFSYKIESTLYLPGGFGGRSVSAVSESRFKGF